ncbi:hydroxyacylglutathione hydrolase [Phytophthora infestans T30-4]|uniref:hydroxyacylglutathione hydrolase n=1 Tax=Phytophthora infestans (strain T30-4) TaxID=403677 RepID=D0NJX7_PHYIT|nr:hydroxyacylglutathione hydrolase [Phytophthora infestans T30-4]EEY59814.1 hydroxyacylglutathione hydrolase [Phytophthora infestans T30-4]|eukprot:XP_002900499.1 hydroxyacylglutathione hydrolase [Phytophthora infestans T30-4]
MQVELVPVLSDNYAYLLIDTATRVAAAVDPVDAAKVYSRAKELRVTVSMILTTHSHWDHAGGNRELVDLINKHESRQIPVVGGPGDAVEAQTHSVTNGDVVKLGDLDVNVYFTPCHTRDHVLYHCQDALFTGDTLFIAGCGRFFSGNAAEMHHALNEVVAKLPEDTKIYCGHEYTTSNLRFAAHVEPENEVVQKKLARAEEKTKNGQPTVPSTVKEELATNPFMRVTKESVQKFANNEKDPVKVMGIVRAAKDNFVIGK